MQLNSMFCDYMIRKIISMSLFFTAILTLSSCLRSEEEDLIYYSDTAISSFSLGTLNRYLHTTSSTGADSVYKTTVTGSNYKMNIDQMAGLISNKDSLPYGTDISKVLITVGAKNGGTVVLKSLKSDSLNYISTTDSLDFTQPRTLFVYAYDGSGRRQYTVSLKVHQQIADTLVWRQMASNSAFTAMKAIKALALGTTLYVLGTDGTTTTVYATNDGQTWRRVPGTFDATAYQNAIIKGKYLYIYSNGELQRTTGDDTWTTVAQVQLAHLVGAGTTAMYAIDGNGRMALSTDDGATWQADDMDDDALLLPSQDFSFAVLPSATNDSIEQLVLVGNRAPSLGDNTARVWTKTVDYSTTGANHPGTWAFVTQDDGNRFLLPSLRSLSAFAYDEGLIALGGAGIGTSTVAALSQMYYSLDGGITWRKDTRYTLPATLKADNSVVTATADADHFIWIVSGQTGEVWHGRLNKLGWSQDNDLFLKAARP